MFQMNLCLSQPRKVILQMKLGKVKQLIKGKMKTQGSGLRLHCECPSCQGTGWVSLQPVKTGIPINC